ncbi:MAG: SAM-dependent DNA methyltransferase, partial [Candidatus Wallbacteria bacterium]|nr:SAM-dependent DNA methyltransferase [Candidatus Wallbacteria bacterium]
IKHDAVKIMEFTREGDLYRNGFGELIDLEDEYVYPILKSSDLGNSRIEPRKYVLVTQTYTGEDTGIISIKAPKTWHYLLKHSVELDNRRSTIYQNRPRFSIFGIGRYSFSPWKVAVSGLYKSFHFVVVPPYSDRPMMIDDTCYSIPCNTEAEANFLFTILSSNSAKSFFESLIFKDSKRPVTIDVLRRFSFESIAKHLGRHNELHLFVNSGKFYEDDEKQLLMVMEHDGNNF